MLRIKPVIEVVSGACGGHDWMLYIPCTKKSNPRRLYLGQDVRFIRRMLGMSTEDFIREVACRMRSLQRPLNMCSARVRQAIAALIIEKAGGLRAVRKMEAWELCAQ